MNQGAQILTPKFDTGTGKLFIGDGNDYPDLLNLNENDGLVQYRVDDVAGGVENLPYPGKGSPVLTAAVLESLKRTHGSFKLATLLGDSITAQHRTLSAGAPIDGAQGFWNWANWLIGAPFDFQQVIGVGGSIASDIFSRLNQIPTEEDTVFVLAGTNDINNLSSSANTTTVTALVDSLVGTNGAIRVGLSRLKAAGFNVAVATVPPNNSWTAGDSRISALDQVNAWILNAVTDGYADELLDLFTVCWDSTQPTARVFKTGYSTDGTHPSNVAGLMGGLAFKSAMKRMYYRAGAPSGLIRNRQNQCQYIGAMRTINGVTSTISTGGGGTQSSGWRSLRGAGSPTWVASLEDYSPHADYVGPAVLMLGYDEKRQVYEITSTAANDAVRTQLNTQIAAQQGNPGISAGDEIFAAIEIEVTNPVELREIMLQAIAYHTAGAAPADQPYSTSTGQSRSTAGINSVSQTSYAIPQGFRAVIRTPNVRVAENISNPTAMTAQFFCDAVFTGAGSATVKIGRPQFWRKY